MDRGNVAGSPIFNMEAAHFSTTPLEAPNYRRCKSSKFFRLNYCALIPVSRVI